MKQRLNAMRAYAGRIVHRPWSIFARRLEGKSQGQALIYVSIMMMTLLGFAALVTDGGLLFVNRRHMQNAVDAAALAGAQNLPMPPNDALGARPVSCDYAKTKNGVPDMVVDCSDQGPSGAEPCNANPSVDILVCQTYVLNDSVRVTAHKTFHPLFGVGLGFADIEIRTQAIAVVGSIRSACIGPLFQTQDLLELSGVWGGSGVVLNQLTLMKFSTDDSKAGNFLGVRVGNGGSAFRDRLADPTECTGDGAPQTSGSASTETGNLIGPFSQGMSDRQAAWTAQGNCPSPDATTYLAADGRLWNGSLELTPSSCYRMIILPLLDGTYADFNGTKSAPIAGFLTFYISDYCGNGHCPSSPSMEKGELLGYYVGFIAAGGVDFQPYDGFGTKVVALIG
jgi:hypothetical protein